MRLGIGGAPTVSEYVDVFDADAHILEPADLFADVLPDAARVIRLPRDTPVLFGGRLSADTEQLVRSNFSNVAVVAAMNREEIRASALFPSLALWAPYHPAVSAAECVAACSVYNEWVIDYCAPFSDRLFPVALIPQVDPALAAAHVDRLPENAFVGAMVRPNYLYGRNLGDAAYDPVYHRLAERGLPLLVHEGLGLVQATAGSDRFESFALRHACSHPIEMMYALASLLLEGTFQRCAGLRAGFFEAGAGWVPYWLDRLQGHSRWQHQSPAAEPLREAFARHCFVTIDCDERRVPELVADLGNGSFGFASDFPHPDCHFPRAVAALRDSIADLELDTQVRLRWTNSLKFFGLRPSQIGAVQPERDRSSDRSTTVHSQPANEADSPVYPLLIDPVPFLSSEWFQAWHDPDPPSSEWLIVDFSVQTARGPIDLHVRSTTDTIQFCEGATSAQSSVALSEAVARALFLRGNQEDAVAAFVAGELTVSGPVGDLLVLQQRLSHPNARMAQSQQRALQITLDEPPAHS